MSKYYKAEEVQTLINSLRCYGIPELNLDGLPTIEVSEDAISREYLKSFGYINKGDFNSVETIREWIDNAPSVVPSRAEGEWIGTEYDGFADGNPVYYEWICSACKCVVEDEEPTWNYCPNCGAKMKGAE